jgi:hypothetical protein
MTARQQCIRHQSKGIAGVYHRLLTLPYNSLIRFRFEFYVFYCLMAQPLTRLHLLNIYH